MTPAQFDHLLTFVGPIISKNNTNYRDSIQAKDRLALTLRLLPILVVSTIVTRRLFSIILLASVDADYKVCAC
ncbi:hypothetical protein CEXT_520081 [Caerostris extrusa]|uniref:Uncharacterized protein n=1 Tax=Caerostris extrusa TaxID=172846 RepID=A0AAV4PSJ2_CAEEX|nr:hypothetical protein CEXT_520081 [Caerostris extrusa]